MQGCYEYYDKQFYELTIPNAGIEELYCGCLWAEFYRLSEYNKVLIYT